MVKTKQQHVDEIVAKVILLVLFALIAAIAVQAWGIMLAVGILKNAGILNASLSFIESWGISLCLALFRMPSAIASTSNKKVNFK